MAFAYQTGAILAKFGCILILRRLLAIIIAGGGGDADMTEGVILATALAVLNFFDGFLSSLASWHLSLAIFATLACIAQAVLKKAFALHTGVQGKFRRGDLVNLALSDCNRLTDMASVLMLGLTAPIMLLFSMVLLAVLIGPLVLASLLTVIGVALLINLIGKTQGNSFRGKATWQGRRLAVMNEMLQSVRFTKFYALEDHYEAQAQELRQRELRSLRWMKASISASWPLAGTVPILTAAVVLSIEMALNGSLPSPPDTLAILATTRFMYVPFAFFSGAWGAFNMLLAVTARLGDLLSQPELDNRPFRALADVSAGGAEPQAASRRAEGGPPQRPEAARDVALSIKGRDFRWGLETDQPPTLKSITIEVPRGELWAIVGPLGSGKSSLLAAAAGAISCDALPGDGPDGGVAASGPSRTYVAQEPVVVNDTLRQNVLFGIEEAADEELERRYSAALEAAALGHDLKVLPAGEATEIGEKGLTLSGGQKARVALARAVLASKPGGLVLLDDPLAAVDAHVGAHLFERCIVEALDGTTRLLVTNQLQFLDHAAVAHVLVMEDGCIVEQGRFADLLEDTSSRLAQMASSVGGGKGCGGAGARDPHQTEPVPPSAAESKQPAPKKEDGKSDGRLTKAEGRAKGAVSRSAFKFYFGALGGVHVFACLQLSCWVFNLGEMAPDLFLVAWQDDLLERSQEWYLGMWLAIGFGGVLLTLLSRGLWVLATMRAAGRIHTQLLRRVLGCTTSFFDTTPSGRIMNRLGEDQMLVDFTAPLQLEVTCISAWTNADILAFAVIVRPFAGPAIAVLALCFFGLREVHRRTNREAMRLFLMSKSPLFSSFEECLSGATTIRAFGRDGHFQRHFEDALRVNLSFLVTKDATNLWIEQRLYFLASLVVLALGLLMVSMPGDLGSPMAAVAVVYALQLGFHCKTLVYFLVQVEGTFASVERIFQFTKTAEQEPPRHMPTDESLERCGWPAKGARLVFEDVCLRYLPHLPPALDHLSATLVGGEKVGIVGRTGSGKSTIMGALLRIVGLESGRILLGDVDIAACGLALLRKRVTIVPQDPILFSGDLRKNLDPLGAVADEGLWEALRSCSLLEFVESLGGGLGSEVAEGGRNFSVGERQVLCLARALLRDTSVLCLDEATANVDPESDQRIQKVLSEEVKGCLVLTIAHRLHTVLHSDRIMVLEQGRLGQLDSPRALLASPGIFSELAAQAGIGLGDLPDIPAMQGRQEQEPHGLAADRGSAEVFGV